MRLLVLATDVYGAVGGIAAFNRALVSALETWCRKHSSQLMVFVLNDSPDSSRSCTFQYRPFRRNRWALLQAVWSQRGQVDAVWFGHVHLTPLVFLLRPVRSTLIAHGIEVWKRLSWMRRCGIRKMDQILCVSDFTRRRLMQAQGISAARCLLFPDTLMKDEEVLQEPPGPIPLILPEGLMILTVGRWVASERYKGVDHLIKSLIDVHRRCPGTFLLVAGDGDDRPRLQQLARDLGVSSHVYFAGTVSKSTLDRYYRDCAVFALPSTGEGFGIVFLEAMAHAKACVGARAGGIPEVVLDGQTGLLVKPDDPEQLTNVLTRLLSQESLRRRMGQAGKTRLDQIFSFTHFQKRLEELMTA